MFFISLGCCDLVLLGIEWLVALGDISWNFDKLAMAFQIGGKWHVLHCAMTNGIHKPQWNRSYGQLAPPSDGEVVAWIIGSDMVL